MMTIQQRKHTIIFGWIISNTLDWYWKPTTNSTETNKWYNKSIELERVLAVDVCKYKTQKKITGNQGVPLIYYGVNKSRPLV